MRRRVVITGMGAVTPLGVDLRSSWEALCQGRSGIRRIAKFDPSGFRTQIAGEVRGFDPQRFMDAREVRHTDPFIHFALGASLMAVQDAGLDGRMPSLRSGAVVGTAMGGIATLERNHRLLLQGRGHRISPFFVPSLLPNMATAHVAIRLGLRGPNSSAVTACATGAQAIGEAFRCIQRGEADLMVAGGTEAAITPLVFSGLDAMRAMSTRNQEPERASRPFDRQRDGFVAAEGAGIVVLEELGHALRRGARIYAEVLGYAANNDAHHITAPHPQGDGAARCMAAALRDAGRSPQEVDYINAHGTGTPLNDVSETRAIKRVFGRRAYRIPVSATKSMTGHMWGAAGSVEAIFTALSLYQGVLPPTINLEEPDAECDLDYVPLESRCQEIGLALSNSFGFGGVNVTLVLGRWEG